MSFGSTRQSLNTLSFPFKLGNASDPPKSPAPLSPTPTKVEPSLESTMDDLKRQMRRAGSARKSTTSSQFNGLLQQKQSTTTFKPMLSDKLG